MDNNSPVTIAHHRLLSPKIMGNKKANPIWKTNDLAKETAAEMLPLFRAVKKLDVYIEKPMAR